METISISGLNSINNADANSKYLTYKEWKHHKLNREVINAIKVIKGKYLTYKEWKPCYYWFQQN